MGALTKVIAKAKIFDLRIAKAKIFTKTSGTHEHRRGEFVTTQRKR